MGCSLINLRIYKYHFMFLKKGCIMKQDGIQIWRFYFSKNKNYKNSWRLFDLFLSFN